MGATGIDEAKLEAFMGQAVTDMGAIISAPLMVIGEKLGLYKAMAGAGPLSSQEVAERSGAAERYVREWLRNQAAGGYVTYDPESDRYTLPDEHALALADEDSPFYILGVYESIASLYADEDQILEAFRSGAGMGWHEHDHRLFRGTERFFRPGYRAHLVAEWIPALDGVQAKLERGAKVADVGCGHGASTVIMAEAFPNSEFFGFDYHDASIERAREAAEEAGVGDRITFEVASAKDYPGRRLRPRLRVRLPARHGRPRRGVGARARDTRPRRHVDDRRAVRQRPSRGEPQPGRARFLRRLDGDLHAGVARPGGRSRVRRAGGRGAAHRGPQAGRVHTRAPRHRDAVQPHPRSKTVAARRAAAAFQEEHCGADRSRRLLRSRMEQPVEGDCTLVLDAASCSGNERGAAAA